MYKFINIVFFITTSLLKPLQSFKIIIGLYVAYLVDLSMGQYMGYGHCEDVHYTPLNGFRNPNYLPGHFYRENIALHFGCYQNYVPANGSVLTCRVDVNGVAHWWPSEYPTCISNSKNVVEVRKPCLRPKNPNNGAVLCCDNGSDLKYCCEYGSYAQFTCKEGYTLQSRSSQWECGHDGKWKDPQTEKPQSTRHPPACVIELPPETPPQVGAIQLSSDMLTTLIGVAVGVLSLLLLVIILAFCKPRLKDIKRRWRDLREDENRLVVNGQEVHLPSYDEAILPDQEQWTEPILPASSMLNSLSRPDFSSLETHQAFLHSRQLQNITLPPVSNLQEAVSLPSYDEQQPCCSRSLLDITSSPAVGQARPSSLSSSTSSAGGGFGAFHSFLVPTTLSTNAVHDEVAGRQQAAALAGSSSCNTITTLVIDCEQFDCSDDDDEQSSPSSQMQSTSSAPDAATAQDGSSLLLDSCNLTTSMVADDSLNDQTNFDDNFVTNAIEPLPPSSPADKAVQPNISFFSVLAPDIQLEGGGDSTEGGPEAKKTETKWTRF